uniref:Protein transport protein SEC24 n=1 Tax=Steinernema glaseri TaxID=37863 RepID=A0A1I7YZF0_9BILA
MLPSMVANNTEHCSPEIFRCTLSGIPQTQELLKKCRLPLGLTLHPYRDLKQLNVLQTPTIVRCRYCRTYINPYVYFPDGRHWKCNLCYRVNDLPTDFNWDPINKCFSEPTRRPEIKHATVEFIAPSEYMLRPPQPALYMFVLDVSAQAVETGYLHAFSKKLRECLDSLPGDDRLLIGFVAVDSAVHFYEFAFLDGPPRELVVDDVDDMFLPVNSGLYVPLKEYRTAVEQFVLSLPSLFEDSRCSSNCLGSALTIVRTMIADIGGRITVMQASLPNMGPGKLESREDPNQRASAEVKNMGPATDFYKSFALECTGNQIAVDLFMLSSQYNDLATLSGMSKYSSGSVYHFPNYHINRNQPEVLRYNQLLHRYLTRKIGFEAVLRIRCSRGVSLHSFYGNFFIRSTDLLALANVNPEAAIGVQVQLDDGLEGCTNVSFQAALLYTSSRGDRRIRVHTLCLPVISEYGQLFTAFDVNCTVSLLAKMAAERVMCGNDLADSREALINAAIDALGSYNRSIGQSGNIVLAPPGQLGILPLYILGLLKHSAFVAGGRSVKLDSRVAAMLMLKNAPLEAILLEIYPALYAVHNINASDDSPPRLSLTYEKINRDGLYLMDAGTFVYLYVGAAVSINILNDVFGVDHFSRISEDDCLEARDNILSKRLHEFIRSLERYRGVYAPVVVIREDSPLRETFTRRLIEDRTESSHSYIEFLNHIKNELRRS